VFTNSANAGYSFSPYAVPNVGKSVAFKKELPKDLSQGMGYLKEDRNERVSPLRQKSPRRQEKDEPREQDMSYMARGNGNRNTSPLRASPRRSATPTQ